MPQWLDILVFWILPIMAAIGAVAVGVLAYQAEHVRVVRDEIPMRNLPQELDKTTIAFLSDVHCGPWFGHQRMHHLVSLVNSLHPDVLILGGDYVGGRRNGASIFYPGAARFEAKYGKVAVLGNHDVWEGIESARRGLSQAGIQLLENRHARLAVNGGGIVVAGVDDLFTGTPSVREAGRGVSEGDVSVLVSHNPDVFSHALADTIPKWGLALGGHTHGGQVSLASARADVRPRRHHRFRSGWFTEHGVPVLISNGVGTVMLPLRFQAPPEVHLITLRAKPAVIV